MSLRLFLCGIVLCLAFAPASAFAVIAVQQGIPDGFEQLETPRASMISLYYGGDFLGSFPVRITPRTVQFDAPLTLIEAIPALQDKAAALQSLQQPLDKNAALICRDGQTQDCGALKPETIGIIYNDRSLSAELFINASLLSVSDSQTHYLQLPEKQFSSVYGFNGAVNGTTQDDPSYNLANNAIFSYGEKKLTAQTSYSNTGLRFDTMEASIERKGWNKSAGLFRSRPMQLGGDVDMAGVGMATSTNTVLDASKTQGNDILLYLPRRSFVSIYREERLYSSRAYEAGNQLIDTSELPDGAYTVTLRIQEANGATREESRFFAKNQEIPPKGRPVYYAQGGVVREPNYNDSAIPQLTGKPLMRFGMVRRVTDNIGFSTGMTGIADRAANETGIFWLKDASQLRLTGMASTRGDAGFNANYLYMNERMNAAFDFRNSYTNNDPDVEYQNLFSTFKQASFTGTYALTPDVTLGFRGSYSSQKFSPSVISAGPYVQWRIWQRGESMLDFSADAARTDGRNQGNVLMRFTHRIGDYGMSATAGNIFGPGSGPTGSGRVWYQKNRPGHDILIGGGVSHDPNNTVVSSDADWRNNFGQVHGSIQQATGNGGSNLNYGGNFSFNAAQVKRDFHLGGNQNDSSAIVVHVDGDAKTRMKVFVNGREASSVKTGHEQVIYLSPFHSYAVRLAPEKPGLLDYESNNRKVTLYPGNVLKLNWTVNRFYVVAARIVLPDGQALGNAVLEESRSQVSTSENGQVQAELSNPRQMHFTSTLGRCAVTLPDMNPDNGVLLYREPLTCVPVSQNLSAAM